MRSRALCLLGLASTLYIGCSEAESVPPEGLQDPRVRVAVYRDDEVYRLSGLVGFQIELQFAPDEHFVGLAAGDIEGLGFEAQANHLFLKPRAAKVATNLTILTDRRAYRIDYRATQKSDGSVPIYAVRFLYPTELAAQLAAQAAAHEQAQRLDAALAIEPAPRNLDYAFCGPKSLKPDAAWDDAVQTHLDFGTRAELPAVFVRNEDGSESLVNFTVSGTELILHRLAPQFILRRGKLVACVVNRSYTGAARQLPNGALSPQITRTAPTVQP